MIIWENRTIVQGDITDKIIMVTTIFKTPFGITPDLDQAIKICRDNDLDPQFVITTGTQVKGSILTEVVL